MTASPRSRRVLSLASVAAALGAALLLAEAPGGAQVEAPAPSNLVDLELVLLVDVSPSMDYDEFEIQREGYIAAFRHDDVVSALLSGVRGRVAVTYVEWGASREQYQLVPWTVIASKEDAAAFADALERQEIISGGRTSISSALLFAAQLVERNEYDGLKRVIDVSGDGPNNDGIGVEEARDLVGQRGITINGLPIVLRRADSWFDIDNLDQYYKDCVITGPGAFTAPVDSLDQLGPAIRGKLVLEIVGLPPQVAPAQFREEAPEGRANCMIGEQLLRRRGLP